MLTVCSQAHCARRERTHAPWWLPEPKVPLCEMHFVRWLISIGVTRLR
jgi:hypothetical protein